jgi:hypothetical protein
MKRLQQKISELLIEVDYVDTKYGVDYRKHIYLVSISHDNGNNFSFEYKVSDKSDFFHESLMEDIIKAINVDFSMFVLREFTPTFDWANSVMCGEHKNAVSLYEKAVRYSEGIKSIFSQNFIDTIKILDVLK